MQTRARRTAPAVAIAVVVTVGLVEAGPAWGAASRTFPGSATGSVKSRPIRATAVDDAKADAREALDRSCTNLATAMHARRGVSADVRVVKVTVSDGRGSGWDATVMLSGTCTLVP